MQKTYIECFDMSNTNNSFGQKVENTVVNTLDNTHAKVVDFWKDFGAGITSVGADISDGLAKISKTVGNTDKEKMFREAGREMRSDILEYRQERAVLAAQKVSPTVMIEDTTKNNYSIFSSGVKSKSDVSYDDSLKNLHNELDKINNLKSKMDDVLKPDSPRFTPHGY